MVMCTGETKLCMCNLIISEGTVCGGETMPKNIFHIGIFILCKIILNRIYYD